MCNKKLPGGMNMKVVIVGGVAGGATAAARLRRLSEETEIIMFERDEFISFANCGLPYYIGNVITDREKLKVETVEGMSKKFNLDIRNFSEVVGIDKETKTVTVRKVQTNEEYTESYDKLILSPGAKPIVPNIKGLNEAKNLFTLRNIPDTDAIYAHLETGVKTATVIGGGFIGIEMAENLKERGVDVTLIERANQVMPAADFEMAQFLHQELEMMGVNLVLSDSVSSFEENGSVVVTESGKKLNTDMIILSIGVSPESHLAKVADLEIGVTGAIKVNDQLLTSDENIYAIGDAIEVKHLVSGLPSRIPLAWPANRQGRLVADHINGLDVAYKGSQGTGVCKVFGLTYASTGLNERQIKETGLEYTTVHANRNNHAGYYPGATPINLKVMFETKTGKLLGAQGVGRDGVEKRIDVIATAIRYKGNINDLSDLELSYAPPYGSAKDPVNILGYIGENVFSQVYKTIQWYDVDQLINEDKYFLDVRTTDEVQLGMIDGATHIDVDEVRYNLDKLPKDKTTPIYVYCGVGHRAYLAIRVLQENGYNNIYNLIGGYGLYKVSKYETGLNVKYVEETTQKEVAVMAENYDLVEDLFIDACGLQCPGPIMQTKKAVDDLEVGQVVKITSSDFGFYKDIATWCDTTCNTLLDVKAEGNTVVAYVKKGSLGCSVPVAGQTKEGTTLVMFSGDLDKVMAGLIIANGAAATGKDVSLFFTFWGLNTLRKNRKVKVNKPFMDSMFGRMLPRGTDKLKLSQMNMGGLGTKMMKRTMKKKNVDSLDVLLEQAREFGVKFVACTMSMDVMGIQKEELLDFVEFGGVATYIGDSYNSNHTLFI